LFFILLWAESLGANAIHPEMYQNRTHSHAFCSCDLDLDPVILIFDLDLGILKMYWHTENEVSRSMHLKVRA